MKIKKRTFLLSVLLVTAVIVGISLLVISRFKTYNAPSWRDITPGISTQTEVVNILGLPNKTEERGGFLIYTYQDYQNLGWKWVEIWFESQSLEVVGILLTIPGEANSETNMQLMNLAQAYGKPNFISWSTLRYERFFAWTDRGIAIEASISSWPQLSSFDLSTVTTTNTFLFEPQPGLRFTRFKWPWPAGAGWNSENMYQSGTTDAPDLYPKDPIDWHKVLR